MKNQKGFTLAELMFAIGLIGILSSLAVPTIASSMKRQNVVSACYEVQGALQAAKIAALKKQTQAVVGFTEGTGAHERGEYWVSVDDKIIRKGFMPKDVVLYHADFNGNKETQFNAMGYAYGHQGEIRIRDVAGEIYKRIQVTPVGNIRLEQSADGRDGSWN